jgi:RHS repeat-associated protein
MMSRQSGSGRNDYYVYDASDERIGALNNGSGSWKWTIRDTAGAVVREYESQNSASAPWVWVEDFVYDDRGAVGAERPFAEGGRLHFHRDHLGSVRLVTNHSGQAISRHDYAPFGAEITSLNQQADRGYTRQNTKAFTGHERDFNSGTAIQNTDYLDYMHARYYSASWGRFLSVDPVLDIKQATKSPQGWNRYAYVFNNPLRYTDPTGLYVWGKCSGTGEECAAMRERFRTSVANMKSAASALKEGSKERKRLDAQIRKLGDEGKGNININFGYAGKTASGDNLGLTIGNKITINYASVDGTIRDFNLNTSQAAALDAGLTAHETTHAGSGPGVFGLLGMRGERSAYTNESITFQGLHNNDVVNGLWNENWLNLTPAQLDQKREQAVDDVLH